MKKLKLNEKQIAMLKSIFDYNNNTGSYVKKTHPKLVGGKRYFFSKAMAEGLVNKGLLEHVSGGWNVMYKVSYAGLQYVI